MGKRIAILQSSYIPWKGYFDLIASVDEFVLYDDAQFTLRDWRSRNRIKTPAGLHWLTVPVGGSRHRRIRDVDLPDASWQAVHWKTLHANYARSAHFSEVAAWLEPVYLEEIHLSLSSLNRRLIGAVCGFLGISTPLLDSAQFALQGDATGKLVAMCVQAGAEEYVSGPAARAYLDEASFAAQGVAVRWFDYSGYREYPQLWDGFVHEVTVLDLLFNCGKDAPRYLKHVNR